MIKFFHKEHDTMHKDIVVSKYINPIVVLSFTLTCVFFLGAGCGRCIESKPDAVLLNTLIVSKDDFRPLFALPGAQTLSVINYVWFSPDKKRIYFATNKVDDITKSSTNILQIMYSEHVSSMPPDYHIVAEIPNILEWSPPVFCGEDSDMLVFNVVRHKGEPLLLNTEQMMEKFQGINRSEMQADARFEQIIMSLSISDGTLSDIISIPEAGRATNLGSICAPRKDLLLLNYGNKIFRGTRESPQTLIEIYPKIKDENLFLDQIAYNPAEEKIYFCQTISSGTGEAEREIVAIDVDGNVFKEVPFPSKGRAFITQFFDEGKKCAIYGLQDGFYICDLSNGSWRVVVFPNTLPPGIPEMPVPLMRLVSISPNDTNAIVVTLGSERNNPFVFWKIREFDNGQPRKP